MGCRSEQRVAASFNKVSKAAEGGWVKAYTYDLSSMQSVRDLAAAIKEDVPSLNVLLNNAGQYIAFTQTIPGFRLAAALQ